MLLVIVSRNTGWFSAQPQWTFNEQYFSKSRTFLTPRTWDLISLLITKFDFILRKEKDARIRISVIQLRSHIYLFELRPTSNRILCHVSEGIAGENIDKCMKKCT